MALGRSRNVLKDWVVISIEEEVWLYDRANLKCLEKVSKLWS